MADGVVLRPNHFGQEVRNLFGLAAKIYSGPVETEAAIQTHSSELGNGRFLELMGDGEVYTLRTHVPDISKIVQLYKGMRIKLPPQVAKLRERPDIFLLKNLTPSHLVRYGDQRIVGSHPKISDEDVVITPEHLGPLVRGTLERVVGAYPTGGAGNDLLMGEEDSPLIASSTGAKYSLAARGFAPVQSIYLFRGITFPTVKALAGK